MMIGKEYKFIIILLMIAIAVSEAATDIYIPSLPGLVAYLNSNEQTLSLTLSMGLFGFCVAAFIYGPLSDSLGRKKVIMFGMFIFTLGSFACSFSQNAYFLLFARFIQGLGIATPYVIGIAIVNDLYHEEQFSKIMSNIHMVVSISPAIAPILGGYIDHYFGWQMSFIIIGVIGFTLLLGFRFLPETHITKHLTPMSLRNILFNYRRLISNRMFMNYALISGITYAGIWCYISTIPFFLSMLSIKVTAYGYYHAVLVLACFIGTYINSRNVERYGVNKMLAGSIFLSAAGAVCLVLVTLLWQQAPKIICAAMAIYCIGMAGVFANATTRAMEVFRDIKGSASSALGCIECLVPAAFVCILGYFKSDTMLAPAIAILIAACSSLGLYLWLSFDNYRLSVKKIKPQKRQRAA
ncbi:MAG: multidrug effflux MFS transporter [Alphaproteobacteria bacterium]|nr:multidrug effflux MFS transporter [Alphaproteobacteria bacterium]